MASRDRKRKASASRDSQSENPIDDSPSDSKIKIFFLSGSNIDRLQEQYHIPEQFQLFAPDPHRRVNSPPPNQVAFYVEGLRTGLRFPIPEFVRNLLDYYHLCPAQ